VSGLLSWQEGLDDAHAPAAAWAGGLERCWLLGLSCRSLGIGRLDGIDRNEWRCEQFADAADILDARWAGEETVVADAVEALASSPTHRRGKKYELPTG